MSSVHPLDPKGQAIYRCAQGGCPRCLEQLLHDHEGLIHAVLQRQYRAGALYADLLQEGRIALWQAILHYDLGRGVAFSTYAWQVIRRRIWRAVAQAQRPQGWSDPPQPSDPAIVVERKDQHHHVQAALVGTLRHLPPRLAQVVVAVYGLDGQPPCSMAAVGRRYGVTRECVRQWRNAALCLLRLPALSVTLRALCAQDDVPAYVRAAALNQIWARQRRGR